MNPQPRTTKRALTLVLLLLVSVVQHGGWSRPFWHIASATVPAITWVPHMPLPHTDHVEMSGKRVSVVLRYGMDATGRFTLNKSMVWPMLRTLPNNTFRPKADCMAASLPKVCLASVPQDSAPLHSRRVPPSVAAHVTPSHPRFRQRL